MVCFVNVKGVHRILYAIFNRFNLEWAQHALPVLHMRLGLTRKSLP